MNEPNEAKVSECTEILYILQASIISKEAMKSRENKTICKQ